MTVKLLMNWDIKSDRQQEYFEFVVREWVPGMQRLGLEPTDAWYTVYGDSPQILTSGTAADLGAMRAILDSDEWESLRTRLLQYVENYQEKVVKAKGGFQL
jgi:hypothetical protein